ncbi:hypothetical protein AMTRI_Chr09g36930 [Amborella trichopoda]
MVKEVSSSNGLRYITITLIGQEARVMVYTSATHNFVWDQGEARLDLKPTDDTSKVKVVNSAKVGDWTATINLVVVPMDDFKVILGFEFLIIPKASAVPHLGVVAILDEKSPGMIHMA